LLQRTHPPQRTIPIRIPINTIRSFIFLLLLLLLLAPAAACAWLCQLYISIPLSPAAAAAITNVTFCCCCCCFWEAHPAYISLAAVSTPQLLCCIG
jgi:hypothetical protein